MTEHEAPDAPHGSAGSARTWIFGITNLPFGVAGGYVAVAVPFFLRQAGFSVEDAAAAAALFLIPSWIQFLYAPVVDLGIRRREWLILLATVGGLCLGGSLLVQLPGQIVLYRVLVLAGQALCGLVGACNGALIAVGIASHKRDEAAGWVNAANLGAVTFGGGVVMTLVRVFSHPVAAVVVAAMIILPAFAALTIHEAPASKDPILPHLQLMATDVWRAVSARIGWTGLVFCLSPVGTVVLGNVFSALGPDYGVSDKMTELVNGYLGGVIQAVAALASGFLLSRVNRRTAYIISGALTAVCAFVMSLGSLSVQTYVAGCVCYFIVTGLAYTAFSAVVYEIVGKATKTAATLYSVFPAAGNFAIWYTTKFDEWGQHYGTTHGLLADTGLLWADAIANVAGVVLLLVMLRLLFNQEVSEEEPLAEQGVGA